MLFINGTGNQTFESFYLKHFDSLQDLQNCTECFKNLSIYSESIYYQVSSSTSSLYRLLKEGDYWLDENYWRNGGNNFTSSYVLGNLNNNSLNIITSGSTRIYVSSSGQVGLNTINPNEILSVNGNIDYTGRLKISGLSGSEGQFLKVTGSNNRWVSLSINDISDFGNYTSSLSGSVSALNSFSASIKTYTSSMNTWTSSFNTYTSSISSSLNGLNLFTSSIKSYTSSMNTYTSSISSSLNGLNLFTASINNYTSSMNTWTSSISASFNNINLFTSSINLYTQSNNTIINNFSIHTSSMNIYTSSVSSSLNGLNSFSASIKTYTSSMNTWTGSVSSSLNGLNLTTGSLESFTASLKLYTSSMNIWTSSLNTATGSFFRQNGNSFGTDATLGTIDNFSLQFITNNVVKAYISSSGNFGINTINPSSKLVVIGSNSGFSGDVFSTATFDAPTNLSSSAGLNVRNANGSSLFRIGGDGNVAIGNFNASVPLHISSSGFNLISLSRTTYGTAHLGVSALVTGNVSTFYVDHAQANSGVALLTRDATNTQIRALNIKGDGLIGMAGNTNPQVALHIGDSTAQVAMRLSSPSTGSAIISLAASRQYDLISDASGGGTPIVGAAGFAIRDVSSGQNRLTIDSAGNVSIGVTAAPASYNLRVSKTITGGTSAYGIVSDGLIASDVTNVAFYNRAIINTQAASFGVNEVMGYGAYSAVLGAGSSITSSYGFYVSNTFATATNSYGFMGLIPSGSSNRWNLFMAGTAPNYLAGKLLIGTTAAANRLSSFSLPATGSGTIVYGILNNSAVGADVSTSMRYFNTISATFVNAGVLPDMIHYMAEQGTIGAGSSITTQHGFWVGSSLSGASTNIAFRGNIGTGSDNWNLYMNGAANNHINGALGIGTTDVVNKNINLTLPISGNGTLSFGMSNTSTVQNTVSGAAYYFYTQATTQAGGSTLQTLAHYTVTQAALSTDVNIQTGFWVGNSMNGAANNYAFRGSLSSGTAVWNLYMDGSATNYLAGRLGVGSTILTNRTVALGLPISGSATAFGVLSNGAVTSGVTDAAYLYYSQLNVPAVAGFTSSLVSHFATVEGAVSSTVNVQVGYDSGNLTSALQNYGFRGLLSAGTGKWNLYMGGTANNYMNGALSIGSTLPHASASLDITSTTRVFLPPRMTTTQRDAIAVTPTGSVIFNTTTLKHQGYTGTAWADFY